MKKVGQTKIIWLLVTSLLVAFFPPIASGFIQPDQTSQSTVQSGTVSVRVIQTSFSRVLTIAARANPGVQATCAANNTMTDNLVQDTGLINLNQPEQCFSLQLGRVITQQHLAMGSNSTVGLNVIVAETGPHILSAWHPASVPVATPSLPAAASAGIIMSFVAGTATILSNKRRRIFSGQISRPLLSLSQLGMLRC